MLKNSFLVVLLVSWAAALFGQQTPYGGKVGRTLAESTEWWPEPARAPKAAPNIVWILLDDVGFGASSAFGGLIKTPVFDSLANNGLRYTNFHTCAICAPTRAALLTGRNQHYVHMGGFAHSRTSAGFPGWDGKIPADKGTIAEILRENGYNSFAVGKWGVTPDVDATDAGPFDRWPLGKGFDHFLGFLGSQTDQYVPDLVEDNAHVQPDGRHLSDQITDKALFYLKRHRRVAPDKPFFLYYAPGAVHAPHQVAAEWVKPYKGAFDDGWDAYREKVLANQKRLGLVPANAQLPPRGDYVKPWAGLSADEKRLYARFMETYAGYLTYTDFEVGRIVNYLKESNQLENTLIVLILGDNGASKEGRFEGVVKGSPFGRKIPPADVIATNLKEYDLIGTPEGKQTNYPLGWAQAANTPFRQWKQDANAEGGTRNPLILFYPAGIKEKGGIRGQYGHVIDVLPTTLEFAGLSLPKTIHSVPQDTLQGTSLVYSVTDPKASSRHTKQYYYIFGSRGIYKDGWKASTLHHPDFIDLFDSIPGKKPPVRNWDADVWELYDLNNDFNERVDLAKKYPDKLKSLQEAFDAEAKKNNVYPLIDWEDVFRGRTTPPPSLVPVPDSFK